MVVNDDDNLVIDVVGTCQIRVVAVVVTIVTIELSVTTAVEAGGTTTRTIEGGHEVHKFVIRT